jgi:hypothetical protein
MPKKSNTTKTSHATKRKPTSAKPKATQTKPTRTRKKKRTSRKKTPPPIEVMLSRCNKYPTSMSVSSRGVEIELNGRIVDLNRAPVNARGNIGTFDVCADSIVRIDGFPFFDCETGEYFPEAEHSKPQDISSFVARALKGSVDSIGAVGSGTIVNMF